MLRKCTSTISRSYNLSFDLVVSDKIKYWECLYNQNEQEDKLMFYDCEYNLI
jgi:hypothetical protein